MHQLLAYLPLLACPVGMALMMWMMRGHGQSAGSPQPPAAPTPPLPAEAEALHAEHRAPAARR